MRLVLTAILGAVLVVGAACSGKTDGSSDGAADASAGAAGSGGQTQCPSDFLVLTGAACVSAAEGCQSGFCVRGQGSWTCSGPCPCVDGWQCVTYGGAGQGCVPAAWAGCQADAGAGGTSGAGGVGPGGAGGSSGWGGGWGGQGGFGGVGGSGGGTGGSGPCGGFPACPGNTEAKFCEGVTLLQCAVNESCPAPTQCTQYCGTCTCHVAPPINGVLNAGCDTCKSDADCSDPGLKCAEDPMLKGSGAMACVMK